MNRELHLFLTVRDSVRGGLGVLRSSWQETMRAHGVRLAE